MLSQCSDRSVWCCHSVVTGVCDDVLSNFAVSTISISHAGDGKTPSLDV